MPTMAPGDVQMPAHEGMLGQLSERESDALRQAMGADASIGCALAFECAGALETQPCGSRTTWTKNSSIWRTAFMN
jgi:hypothetical protein